jgi:uncharacterized membrane protein
MSRLSLFGCSLFLMLSLFAFLGAHEGHHSISQYSAETDFFVDDSKVYGSLKRWLTGIGRFHLLMLHFPIALIVMTVVAEWLWIWYNNPIFEHAARFMILAAAIFALPTALLGLAYGYGQVYEGLNLELFVWHRYFGLLTAGLAIITAILKECFVRQSASSLTGYYICLFLLFISVSLTGAFGGGLAFGLDVW